jgi:hypothetical protein
MAYRDIPKLNDMCDRARDMAPTLLPEAQAEGVSSSHASIRPFLLSRLPDEPADFIDTLCDYLQDAIIDSQRP